MAFLILYFDDLVRNADSFSTLEGYKTVVIKYQNLEMTDQWLDRYEMVGLCTSLKGSQLDKVFVCLDVKIP